MQPNYDDAGWPSGNGVLGFPHDENLLIGGVGVNTLLSSNNAAGSNIITYYFRRTFVLPTTNGISLTASNLLDDGAVIYINGREVARPGMPPGPVSYSTRAPRVDIAGGHGVDTYSIPLDFVNEGTNTVAVEVHQNNRTNSSDMIMGMRIAVYTPPPSHPPIIVTHPQDTRVDDNHGAEFSVHATGTAPLTFRWYTNGVLVPNQNTSTIILASTPQRMDGLACRASVSNEFGVVTSSNAVLRIDPDVNGPKIVSATQTSSNAFELRFDEGVTSQSAQNLANYVVGAVGAVQSLTVTQVLWGQLFVRIRMDANFDLDADYTVCVSDLRDLRGNERTNDCAEIVRVIENGLTVQRWRFNDGIRDNTYADGAWTHANFDDSTWSLGTGLFWEDIDAPVTCSRPATRLQKGRAQYYRRNFMGPSSKAVDATLTLHYVLDDGSVFYVNGREIARHNMPPTPVRYDTNPLETAAEPPVCMTLVTNIPASWLNPGTNNVVAIEVHQAETNPDAFGADMAFDGVLSVTYKDHRLPAVQISRSQPDKVVVRWIGNGWQLRRATAPDGQWELVSAVTTVQGTNSFSDTVSGKRFYRLQNP